MIAEVSSNANQPVERDSLRYTSGQGLTDMSDHKTVRCTFPNRDKGQSPIDSEGKMQFSNLFEGMDSSTTGSGDHTSSSASSAEKRFDSDFQNLERAYNQVLKDLKQDPCLDNLIGTGSQASTTGAGAESSAPASTKATGDGSSSASDSTPAKTASTTSSDTAPAKTASTTSSDTAPAKTASNTASDTAPAKTASTTSSDTAPAKTASNTASDTAPAKTASTTSSDTAPAKTASATTTSPDTTADTNAIPANALNIASFGAVGNGSKDDTADIQAALNQAAKTGQEVYVPEGIYDHSGELNLNGVVMVGAGAGSELKATNPDDEAVVMTGSKVGLEDLTVAGASSSRLQSDSSTAVLVNGATNFDVNGITVNGSASAGIFVTGSTGGEITNNHVNKTNADGITISTPESGSVTSGVTIANNTMTATGDDGISVDTYSGAPAKDITITDNSVTGQTWGRGIAINGGDGVTVNNNTVDTPDGRAGIYVAAEPSYKISSNTDVTVEDNTITGSGGKATGQGAIQVYDGEDGILESNIDVLNNKIIDPSETGIIVNGSGQVTAEIEGNTLSNSQYGMYADQNTNAKTKIALSNNVTV